MLEFKELHTQKWILLCDIQIGKNCTFFSSFFFFLLLPPCSFFFVFSFFFDRNSRNPGWSQTQCDMGNNLELQSSCLNSKVLGLEACAIMPNFYLTFENIFCIKKIPVFLFFTYEIESRASHKPGKCSPPGCSSRLNRNILKTAHSLP